MSPLNSFTKFKTFPPLSPLSPLSPLMPLSPFNLLVSSILCLLLSTHWAFAKEAEPMASDAQVEARLVHIAEELRCLVCQNESLSSSRADLAEDLRAQVREQIVKGRSDQEIKDYLVERYGDFVLYRPAVKPMTWALWFGPFAGLLVALAFLLLAIGRRNKKIQSLQNLNSQSNAASYSNLNQEYHLNSKTDPGLSETRPQPLNPEHKE